MKVGELFELAQDVAFVEIVKCVDGQHTTLFDGFANMIPEQCEEMEVESFRASFFSEYQVVVI